LKPVVDELEWIFHSSQTPILRYHTFIIIWDNCMDR